MDQVEHLSHKFLQVRRHQRAITVRIGTYGLDARRTRRRLDERCCAIRLHLRGDGRWRFEIGSIGDELGLGGAAPVDDDGCRVFRQRGSKVGRRVRQPRVGIGSDSLSGHIPS